MKIISLKFLAVVFAVIFSWAILAKDRVCAKGEGEISVTPCFSQMDGFEIEKTGQMHLISCKLRQNRRI
jgi:hypothetical protein